MSAWFGGSQRLLFGASWPKNLWITCYSIARCHKPFGMQFLAGLSVVGSSQDPLVTFLMPEVGLGTARRTIMRESSFLVVILGNLKGKESKMF